MLWHTTGRLTGRKTLAAGLAALLMGAACSGQIAGGTGGEGDDPDLIDPGPGNDGKPGKGNTPTGPTNPGSGPTTSMPGATPTNPSQPALGNDVGPSPLRRLTRLEYDNTIRDLLGDTSRAGAGLGADQDADQAGYVTGGSISTVVADNLIEAAHNVATAAIIKLDTLLPCKPVPTGAAEQEQCARDFVVKFGRRAYRRPLAMTEVTDLTAFYRKARTELGHDFANGIRMVLEAMLLSPSFVFRWELGPVAPTREGTLVRFNDYEIASRLSYFLWASTPDEALLDAAGAGKLRTVADVERQARRLLADPKARDMLMDFHTQWLQITGVLEVQKDAATYKTFSAAVARSMLAETTQFITNVFDAKSDGKLETLLTSRTSFIDENLAKIYEATGVTGSDLRPMPLGDRRAGILTQGSFLAVHAKPAESHPIKRGNEILQRLLCVDLPVPPADIPEPKPPATNLSTRERFADHGTNACAKACHDMIDPLGFAFEHYDGIGMYRTMDGGKAVDASGAVALGGSKRAFKDAIELTSLLAQSSEVRSCMGKQWMRYALKRRDVSGDGASLGHAGEVFARAGHDMRELLVGIATSRSFFYRKPHEGEVLP